RQRRSHRCRCRPPGRDPEPPAARPLSHAGHRQGIRAAQVSAAPVSDSLRARFGETGAEKLSRSPRLLLVILFACAASISAQEGQTVRDQAGHIVDMSFARTWATDADVERVAAIRTLKSLDLSMTYVSDRGVERLKALDQLEDLNLSSAEFITDAAVAFLRGHRQLKTLNLRGTDVTDTSLAYVAELPQLKSLDIAYTQITDIGLEQLASLAQLEELDLGG